MTEAISKVWQSRLLRWMYSIPLTVICLVLLMILTFWGTVFQVENGLYAAQEKFFSAWFVWVFDVIPFPGAKIVLGLLLVNLFGYMINMLAFQPLRPGIVMIHSGLLVMLVGGAITHYYGEETFLSMWEGETANMSSAYYNWEVAVWKRDGVVRDVLAIDAKDLQPGEELAFAPTPITLTVEEFHPHARAFQSKSTERPYLSSFNISRIERAPLEKEPTRNIPAGIFVVNAPGLPEPTKILLFGDDTAPLIVPVDGVEYSIGMRHRRSPLPLGIKLLDFKKQTHPGTEIASSFSSLVEVTADGITRELTISMNKPLRHRGYTLYQQSYQVTPDGRESSTFAVTHNIGRLLPYVSTAMVVIGMIIHFIAMLIKHARKQARARAAEVAA